MNGLGSGGAQPADNSSSVCGAVSTSGLTWRVSASSTPAPLVAAWAGATVYAAGVVVKNKGLFFRCETGGTSGAASTGGPATVGAVTDGTAIWKGVRQFANGLKIANTETSGGTVAYWDFGSAASASGDPILAGGAFVALTVADPSLIYVVTASSTAALSIAGLC